MDQSSLQNATFSYNWSENITKNKTQIFHSTMGNSSSFNTTSGSYIGTVNDEELYRLLQFIKSNIFYYGQLTLCGFGASTNILLMISMVMSPRLLKNSGGVLIFALTFSDCSLIVSSGIYGYDVSHRVIKDFTYCVLYTYYWHITRCVSHLITMLISINRFALVCYPFSHKMATSNMSALMQLLGVFIFSAVGSVYTFYVQGLQAGRCSLKMSGIMIFYIGFRVVDSICSNSIPVLVTMILTVKVIRSLKRKRAVLGKAAQTSNTSDQKFKIATKAHQAENNLTNALLAVNIAFIIFVLPYIIVHAASFIYLFTNGTIGAFHYNLDIAYYLLYLFEHFNYAINLFLYAWFSPAFRAALIKLFTCGCCKTPKMNKGNNSREHLSNINSSGNKTSKVRM